MSVDQPVGPRRKTGATTALLEFLDRHPKAKARARHATNTVLKPLLRPGVREVKVLRGPLRGTRLMLDIAGSDRDIWLNTYEPWVQAQLVRELPATACLWDVGAYIGTYVLLARMLNPAIAVLAVEPDPANLGRLHRNLSLNGLTDIAVADVAVGAAPGRVTLTSSPERPMTSKIAHSDAGETVAVTLDRLLDAHPAPGLVLMDIEGGEADALRGATSLVTDIRPNWLVELHGAAGYEAYEHLRDCHYEVASTAPGDSLRSTLRMRRAHVFAFPSGQGVE